MSNLTCVGGTVKNNECVCPSGTHAEQSGPNAYRCLANLTCRGGTVQNNQCVCPEGSTPKQIGTNIYGCVANITCTGGKVKDGKCVCPKGTNLTSTGNNAFACVRPSTGGAPQGSTGGTSGGQTGGPVPTSSCPRVGWCRASLRLRSRVAVIVVDDAAIRQREVGHEMMGDDDLLHRQIGDRRIDMRHEMQPPRSDP